MYYSELCLIKILLNGNTSWSGICWRQSYFHTKYLLSEHQLSLINFWSVLWRPHLNKNGRIKKFQYFILWNPLKHLISPIATGRIFFNSSFASHCFVLSEKNAIYARFQWNASWATTLPPPCGWKGTGKSWNRNLSGARSSKLTAETTRADALFTASNPSSLWGAKHPPRNYPSG